MPDKAITPLIYETYLAVIENSIGTQMFKNLYVDLDGETKDIMRDGELSCAFFVSSVLALCGFIIKPRATVTSTVEELIQAGWQEVAEPFPGSVLVWEPTQFEDGKEHAHIGFFIGEEQAVSNDYTKGTPQKHHWKDTRKIEKILWNPKIRS